MSINYVQLTGNMLQPELRQTQTGKTVMSASMVIKGYGESAEDMWVDIQAWENLAKNISDSFPTDRKTWRVMVEGTLKKDTWEDKSSGQARSKFYVNANNISVCLDYQNVGSVNYAGDGNNASTGGDYQAPAQHTSQTNPVARPISEVAEGEAPF